jgi:predicted transcriptional regulator
MTSKELVIEALRRMPEEVTLEEISEEVAILAAVRRGEQAADQGRVVPHEEAKQRSAAWTNTK